MSRSKYLPSGISMGNDAMAARFSKAGARAGVRENPQESTGSGEVR
jgi:hypothetical protein